MTIRTVEGSIIRIIDQSPFRDTLIEIWDRDFGLDDLVCSGRTNDKGFFKFSYDTDDTGDEPDFTLKVFRLDATDTSQLIGEYEGPNNVQVDFDFGELSFPDWEYDVTMRVPLVFSNGAGITASPQNFVLPQTSKILFHGAIMGGIRSIADKKTSIESVQKLYSKSLTMTRTDSRSDDFFVEAILNGFNPALFTYNSESDDYHLRYNIDHYECDDKHQSPSVHLILKKSDDDTLKPIQIEYKVRDIHANPATFGSTITACPSEGEDWEKAKSYFRIADFIDGQVKGHLGRSHINVGQYAIALYRNIQKNPIFKLLHPHLKEVSAINTFGKDFIFGDEGILVNSPLTPSSLVEVMRDDLGHCDWEGWSPREPINEQHRYAKIQILYWNILKQHIDIFFETHQEKIIRDWKEIYFFSKDLVEHSVPLLDSPLESGESWYDSNEIISTDGRSSAISPITQVIHKPDQAEIDKLKQICAYMIYHATIWHDWRNDNQANYGGEIDYARFSINMKPKEASFQLFIVNMLVDVKHGYLAKNEENDIPREFITLLKLNKDKFSDLEYNLRDLRSRINI